MILDALKKRLYQKEEKHPGRWLRELLAIVWGLRTQASRSTSVIPYFLVYGSEAILPANIAFRAPRVENYDEEQAAAVRTEDVDRVEEERLRPHSQISRRLAEVLQPQHQRSFICCR